MKRLTLIFGGLLTVLATAAWAMPKPATKKPAYSVNKDFREVIEKNHRTFERCGQAEVVRTHHAVKGLVLIRFVVNADGKVTDAGPAHNTTKSRAIADCLTRGLEALKFSPPAGAPVTSSYPFRFDLKK